MSYFRRPRTTQERRQNQDGYGRAKRSPKRLVDEWDDVYIGSLGDRCWKRQKRRRHQYRVVEMAA